jgi:hypothetical protein
MPESYSTVTFFGCKGIDTATQTTFSLISPSSSQSNTSKMCTLAPKLMWLLRQRVFCLPLSPGQNCSHISLHRVLEIGGINRVVNDHIGAYPQGIIIRTPSHFPVPVLENRQVRLRRRPRHPQLDSNLYPTPRSRCQTAESFRHPKQNRMEKRNGLL